MSLDLGLATGANLKLEVATPWEFRLPMLAFVAEGTPTDGGEEVAVRQFPDLSLWLFGGFLHSSAPHRPTK